MSRVIAPWPDGPMALCFLKSYFPPRREADILSRSPLMLAMSWLITCLAVLTAGLAVTLAPVEMTLAWPVLGAWSAATAATPAVALVLAVLAGLLLFLLAGSAREGKRARPFGELLIFFPVVFAFVWLLLPAGKPNTLSLILGLPLLATGGYLFRHSPVLPASRTWRWRKLIASLDATMILLPVLLGLALGFSPDLKAGGLSLLLYPLYAFIQLGLFLYIPVTRLRALGVSSENSTLLSAVIFSMIHWPNPLVMLITLVGMLVWARAFQKGRPLWQLAIVMGLTATTFSQFLPDDLTRHMRVGPGYVRSEAVSYLANQPAFKTSADFIEFAYPQTIGRPAHLQEEQNWTQQVNQGQRSTWAYMFLSSDEKRRRLAEAEQQTSPPNTEHWTAWPEEWKSRIHYYASEDYWLKSGKTEAGYLGALYGDILERKASAKEINAWSAALSITQKQRIAEVLLNLRLKQGQAEFKAMDVEEFKYPN